MTNHSAALAALADPTRRAIFERLARSPSAVARRVGSASAVRTAAWLVIAYGKLLLTKIDVKQVPPPRPLMHAVISANASRAARWINSRARQARRHPDLLEQAGIMAMAAPANRGRSAHGTGTKHPIRCPGYVI